MAEAAKETKCSKCGRKLSDEDKERKWRSCDWCGARVCFNCIHYFAVRTKGLYEHYLKVMRLCEKCYPRRRA